MAMRIFRKESDKRIKRPMKKTKAKSGETLIEVLFSLLIISVSIALLVSTVGSSGYLIKGSQEKFQAYYDQSNNLATQTGSQAGGTVTFKYVRVEDGAEEASRSSANTGVLSKTETADVSVNYFINEKSVKTTVASYKAVLPTNDGGSGGSGETPVDGE